MTDIKKLAQDNVKAAQTSTAVTVQNGDAHKIEDILRGMLPKIAQASLANIPPEYIVSTALTVMRGSEKLRECDPLSIVHCVVQSAQVGLSLDPVLQQAAMVPRKGKAVFTPMYKGLLHLARRSEQIKDVAAQPVYENDVFEIQYGVNQSLIHKPPKFGTDRGKIIGWYAYFSTHKGGFQFETMTEAEMQVVKAEGIEATKGSTPWKTDYIPMAKKTILKRVLKLAPTYDRVIQAALAADDLAERGMDQRLTVVDGLVVPTGEYTDDPDAADKAKFTEAAQKVEEKIQQDPALKALLGEPEKEETKEQPPTGTFLTDDEQRVVDEERKGVPDSEWFALAKSALGACIRIGKQERAKDWGVEAFKRLNQKKLTSAQYNELRDMYAKAWPPKPAPEPGLFDQQGNLTPEPPKAAPTPVSAPAPPPVAAPPETAAPKPPKKVRGAVKKGQTVAQALAVEIDKAEKLSVLFTLKSKVKKAEIDDNERAGLMATLNTKLETVKGSTR